MFPFDDVTVVIPVIVAIGMEFHCSLDWFIFTMKRSRFEQGFLQKISNATLKTESYRDANFIVPDGTKPLPEAMSTYHQ